MHGSTNGALGEWRHYGYLPIVGALGYATVAMPMYATGVFIEPIAREFGWSRAEVTAGLTISATVAALAAVPVGMVLDRFGPRKLALVGVGLGCAAFAALGTATGSTTNWYVLWLLLALAVMPIPASVWTSAVGSRFVASRGLALAVTLCGASLALTVFPWLGARLMQDHGWRNAIQIEAAIWAAIAWPPIFLLFRSANDRTTEERHETTNIRRITFSGLGEALKSGPFARLFAAGAFFTFTMMAMSVHFPLMLAEKYISPVTAGAIASLIGASSFVGRLGTGVLLDRFPAALVGAGVFLLPGVACAILLWGQSPILLSLAAICVGLAVGAEIDILVYLTLKYFGLRNFGGMFGGIMVGLSIGSATGPLSAAHIFDVFGSYEAFVWMSLACTIACGFAMATLPSASETAD